MTRLDLTAACSYYPARAVIDHDAIAANLATLRESAGAAEIMAVVKADGYGHGGLEVARTAVAAGADWLGVAQIAEACALRAAGVEAPILAWLVTPGAPLAAAVAAHVDLSASAPWAVEEIAAAAEETGERAGVHLKIDTGMGRGGSTAQAWDDLLGAASRAEAAGTIEVRGVWTHLARADEVGHVSVPTQIAAFVEAVERAERAGLHPRLRHVAASSALLTVPEARFDLVRVGLALYGLSPIPVRASAAELGLRPAMRLEAQVWHVKDVAAGTPVSYGHTYHTAQDTRLAILPVGYGDGVPRHASNTGPVLVGGRRRTISGRVCMDQVSVDLGGLDSRVTAGDVAVLFGDGSRGEPTAQDWAEAAGTISYEIVTRLGARVPRVHVGGPAGLGRERMAQQQVGAVAGENPGEQS